MSIEWRERFYRESEAILYEFKNVLDFTYDKMYNQDGIYSWEEVEEQTMYPEKVGKFNLRSHFSGLQNCFGVLKLIFEDFHKYKFDLYDSIDVHTREMLMDRIEILRYDIIYHIKTFNKILYICFVPRKFKYDELYAVIDDICNKLHAYIINLGGMNFFDSWDQAIPYKGEQVQENLTYKFSLR